MISSKSKDFDEWASLRTAQSIFAEVHALAKNVSELIFAVRGEKLCEA